MTTAGRALRSWSCHQTSPRASRRSQALPGVLERHTTPLDASKTPNRLQDRLKTHKRAPKALLASSKTKKQTLDLQSTLEEHNFFENGFENKSVCSLRLAFHVDPKWVQNRLHVLPRTLKRAPKRPTSTNIGPTWGPREAPKIGPMGVDIWS